jgi:glycosyltransferase involved in cell wall biosynthesis
MKASIIIINYNDKLRVGRAIESAIRQTWKETEVIIVDDGSDAETREVYNQYKNKIKLIQLERTDSRARTPSRARNAGLAASDGEYICFLDSDNYYAANFLESLIKYEADVSFCDWEIVGMENYQCILNNVWDFRKPILENYIKHQHLDHQCLLIKRDYLGTEKYDERLPRSQDCDLIVRLILKGGKFQHIPEKLFTFEKHETDQNKQLASVYGKTLWTLKNNLNLCWLSQGWLNTPQNVLSYNQAINDFTHSEIWENDYNSSDFKKVVEEHQKNLYNELKEKVIA